MNYVISLTETEDLALSYIAVDPKEWIINAAKSRALDSTNEIVQFTVQKCLENNVQIPGSKEEIVKLAFDKEWIKSAAERQAELDAQSPL